MLGNPAPTAERARPLSVAGCLRYHTPEEHKPKGKDSAAKLAAGSSFSCAK